MAGRSPKRPGCLSQLGRNEELETECQDSGSPVLACQPGIQPFDRGARSVPGAGRFGYALWVVSALLQLFEASLRERADRVGLEAGPAGALPRAFSFGELEERAERMAARLAARGVGPGDRLAVQLANRVELIDLFLACLKLGALFVPINVLYREREVGHLVADAAPAAVVTTGERAVLVPAGTATWDVDELAAEATAAAPPTRSRSSAALSDSTPAAIVYTSGTTGRAKGAVLTHGALASNAATLLRAWRITDEDRYLAVLPLFHVHGLANGLCSWLASGCRMRLVERFEHDKAGALFESWRPTLFFGVPTVYVRLLELDAAAARAIGARARLFVSGSAPLPAPVFEAFERRFGHAILERYGMTETLMTIGNPYDGERRPGSVGRPLEGVSVRVVRPDGSAATPGEVGELQVRGPALFCGYWRQPEATAKAFADGWFRSGDLAERSADGYVTLRGRASELILCGGFNVYPREVEEVLLEQPGVREAAVVGTPDALRGERPLAFYAGDAEPEALAAACRRQLASFKVPVAFRRVDALPRNAMGKIEKARLTG
jgi:malonyl-CoA/methylmalonyl-CoA synthetase